MGPHAKAVFSGASCYKYKFLLAGWNVYSLAFLLSLVLFLSPLPGQTTLHGSLEYPNSPTPGSIRAGANVTFKARVFPATATGNITFAQDSHTLGEATLLPGSEADYFAFGDSITYGGYVADATQRYPALVGASLGLTVTNSASPGYLACDIMPNNILPLGTGLDATSTPIYSVLIGTNDVDEGGVGAHEAIFNLCHQASLAWLGVPRRSKVLATDPGVQILSGGWALTPAFGLGTFRTMTTTTPGTVRFTLTTAGSPAYLWYVLQTVTSGSFSVSVDGGPSSAQQSVQPAAVIGNVSSSVALLRLPVPAGTHTFDITARDGSVGVLAMGSAVPAGTASPAVLAGDVPSQLGTGHDATVAAYTSDAKANIEQLIAEGINLTFVPTQNYMKATPAEVFDGIHPTPLGLSHLAQAFEAAITPAMMARATRSFATASLSTSQLTPGDSTISMIYSGDGNNAPTSTMLHLYLYDGKSASTLVPSATVLAPGAALVLTTSVTPEQATGYVNLVDLVSGTPVAVGGSWLDLSILGGATLTIPQLPPGRHTLQADYAGDIHFNGSSSVPIQLVVLAPTNVALTSSRGSIQPGDTVTLNVTVTPKGATGSLQILDGGVPLGTVALSDSTGTYTTGSLALGPHVLSAVYSGDSQNAAAVSPIVTVNVVISIPPFQASVSPTGGLAFAPSGVQVTSALQTVTLTNNGGVPLTLSSVTASGDFFLAPGTNTCGNALAVATACTVQVGFTPTLTGARSGLLTFADNVTGSAKTLPLHGTGIDFSLSPNGPVSASTASGGNATYTLLLQSDPSLPGTVAFTCSGAPAQAMCTVNPLSSSLGSATPVTITVSTGLTTGERHPILPISERRSFWFAAVLPIGLLTLRRRSRRFFSRGLVAMMCVILLAAAGCGTVHTPTSDGSHVPMPTPGPSITPSGTYTLVVTGSSAGLIRSTNLTLTVQ